MLPKASALELSIEARRDLAQQLLDFVIGEAAMADGRRSLLLISSETQDAEPRHPALIWRYGLLPSVAEKVRPSTSVSCTYLAPAIVPEAGTGSVTVAAAPILARIPKGPGSNLL